MSSGGGDLTAAGRRPPSSRFDDGAWVGDGLRREVFFFGSKLALYGSLFAAVEITRPFGILACNSWGVEADRSDPLQRSVALAMAKLGGAGMVFHYPGYGDSYGDLAVVGLDDLVQAAVDAVGEASRRCPGVAWTLAGFMLGASVACLAQRPAGVDRLLLVQPALRPRAYFERLAGSRRALAPGPSPGGLMEAGNTPGMAYGYPIPRRVVERAAGADEAVAAALDAFDGAGSTIRYEKPGDGEAPPAGFELTEVPGAWRFGSLNQSRLASAAAEWLDRRTGEAPR